MNIAEWHPADVLAAVTLVSQVAFGLVLIIAMFTTKKMVDGRMSQLIDLIGRLSGVPDRRGIERGRRTVNGTTERENRRKKHVG